MQEELGRLLVENVKDPRVGFVTVPEGRLADDLRNARVFVSVYGTDEDRATSLKGLQKAASFLRRELAGRLKLRHTPELIFEIDTTLDKAQRLQQVMGAIARGETESPDASALEVVPVSISRSPKPPVR